MKKQTVYILIYNEKVQYASKDIKSLHGAMEQLCATIQENPPLSYVQVWRLLDEKSFYIHTPSFGHQWQIIERELLYARRKKRPAVQHGEGSNQHTPINQQP